MPTIAELLVKVGVDASGVDRQTSDLSRSLSRVGAGLSATVTPAVLGLGAAATSAASDLEESINAVGVVFGPAADKIHAFARTAEDSVGLSTRAFNELVTPVGAALQNVGFSADEAAKASIGLGRRAADMASVFNVDVSEALTAIQAGLRGEADPLERFGVGLSAAAVEAKAMELGLASAGGELSANAKAQARLALLMGQTDKIAGDFAATSGSVANQERIARAEAENMAAAFGEQLIPIKQQLIGVARTLLGAFNGLSPGIRKVILTAGVLAAALGPVLLVAGQIIRVSGPLILAFKHVGKAFLLANPWVAVATAIVALVIVVVKNWDKIVGAISAAWGFIKRITVRVWDAVVGFLKKHWQIILAVIAGPVGVIVGLVVKNWGRIRDFTASVFRAVGRAVSRAWEGIKSVVSGAVRAVRGFVVGGFRRARDVAARAVSRLRSAVVSRFRSMVRFVRGIPGDIVGFFRSLPGRLYDVGRRIIRALIDGIRSLAGGVGDVMGGVVGGIVDLWPFSPAKEGPLRRFPPELAGSNVGALFAAGLASAEADVVAAAERIARQAALDPRVAGAAATARVGAGVGGGVTVRFDFTGVDSKMAEAIRETVRVDGGGDVQLAFGDEP